MSKKIIALLLCGILLTAALAGCGNVTNRSTPTPTVAPSTKPGGPLDLTVLFNTVTDSSDLPDWDGEILTLRYWYGHGMGDTIREKSSNDVYNAELKRIFGIEFDAEKSFDNGGVDLATKVALMAATKDWPEVGDSVNNNRDLVNEGLLYDLTDLLPIYAPNYYAFLQQHYPQSLKNGYMDTGRLYGVGFIDNNLDTMRRIYPDLDMNRYQYISPPTEIGFPLWVRDDILKLAYPNAKTQDEIEALYVANGGFTRAEIFDVPLKSKQDVVDFFYKIKKVIDDNGIKEGNRPVSATWAAMGGDGFPIFAQLTPTWEGLTNSHYWSNFNIKKQQIELIFKTDYFKSNLKIFNDFVRNGVASEDSLVDNNEIFMNKLNNGEYAITWSFLQPDPSKLAGANKPYRYRKVYMDIPQDTSTYVNFALEATQSVGGFSIFKDKVKEEDVPRILQYLDFRFTEAGMKLMVWGPRSAGLFTEENGVRKYTDPELEACMVYGVPNGADLKYNLASGHGQMYFPRAWPMIQVGIRQGGLQNPKYSSYDMSVMPREPASANQFFTSAIVNPIKWSAQTISRRPVVPQFQMLPRVKEFMDVRVTGFEPLINRAMAARTDEEFETRYNEMIKFAADNGLDDDTCREMEKYMQEVLPNDWAAYLIGYGK